MKQEFNRFEKLKYRIPYDEYRANIIVGGTTKMSDAKRIKARKKRKSKSK
jgi:hypothetical protein